jgi:hypothetical protein
MAVGRARSLLLPAVFALSACADLSFFEAISRTPPNTLGAGCAGRAPAAVTSLEVGEDEQLARVDPPFVPLADGDSVRIVRGLQGAEMLVLALRVRGIAATSCVEQRTDVLTEDGQRVSFNARNLPFEAQTDGTATARRLFFPGDFREGPVMIRVTLGGMTMMRRVLATRRL